MGFMSFEFSCKIFIKKNMPIFTKMRMTIPIKKYSVAQGVWSSNTYPHAYYLILTILDYIKAEDTKYS